MRARLPRQPALLAVGALALATVLSACTSEPPPPKPEDAAAALASGLTSGDLGAVTFDGSTGAAATESVRNAVGGLKDVTRTVSVGEVTTAEDGRTATAQLRWTWDLLGPEGPFAYTTTAKLALPGRATAGGGGGESGGSTGAGGGGAGGWRVQWSPTLLEPKLTAAERFVVEREQGVRGQILGAGGEVLVGLRDVYRVGVDKSRIPAEQAVPSATALAALMGIDAVAYANTVAASGPKQFVVAITLRLEDPRIAGRTAAVQAIPGAAAFPGTAMLAPTATFARALLGTVGPATAEIVEKSAGRITANDTVGLSGLQQRYDASLAGEPGLVVRAVGTDPAGGSTSRIVFTRPATNGEPLTTTLDRQGQEAAESVLAATTVPTALVAIRPSTGEIVAAANGPATNGAPVATSGRAAPGSTFKVVTSLALLRAGLSADSLVSCPESVTVDGRSFKNYDDYPAGHSGAIPLRDALAYSCNTAFISSHEMVSQADLADAAAALGVGVAYDTGYAGFVGSVPRDGSKTEHAAAMIGQGKIEASALSMAIVVATIAKGSTLNPRLVDRPSGSSSGASATSSDAASATASGAATSIATATSTPAPTAAPAPAKPLTAAEAATLREMLRAVVTVGSGKSLAGLADGAKTGTAEYGTDAPPRTHAWMVATRGDLAVAAYVEDGRSGSSTAGPLIKAFLQSYAG
ncbi:MAG: penicillin-binding transpeptidase domain-containing protein [Candidatus Phosphoribacter sp.]